MHMTKSQKVALLRTLSSDRILRAELFYDILEECGDLKFNYYDYAKTHPIDCSQELLRLPTADYDTCCALLTMLLREDHFSNSSFELRQRTGEVKSIVDRMVQLLQKSGTAFMVYLDENCQIRTCGIAEDGYESMLLPMLDIATNKARRVAEEAMV